MNTYLCDFRLSLSHCHHTRTHARTHTHTHTLTQVSLSLKHTYVTYLGWSRLVGDLQRNI